MPSIKSVSASQSVVSTDKSVMDADGEEVCTVYITANLDFQDADGQPYPIGGVPASLVTIAIAEGGVVITQPTGNLSATGGTTATFTASTATTKTIVATVNGVALTDGAVVVAGGAITPPDEGDPFFEDDFAGPAFNNAGGFVWGSTAGSVTAVSFDGHNAIRFRYGPNVLGSDDTSEKRFNTGRESTELWIEYYLHLPSNYAHRDNSASNNKFIRLWGDSYGSWSKVGASTYELASLAYGDSATSSRFYAELVIYTTTGMGLGGTSSGNNPGPYNFGANYAGASGSMLNRWTRIRMNFKAPTQIGSASQLADSHIKIWFDNEVVYDWTTTKSNLDPDDNFYKNGYLMGWANSGFTDETDIHIRNIKFYDADPEWTF